MTSNIHGLPVKAHANSPKTSLPACLEPADASIAVAQLSTCMALVRPVGMTDEHVSEWLTIAAQDLAEFPADIIAEGCAAARRVCRFPSEIVPAVVAECEERLRLRRMAMRPVALPSPPSPKPERPSLSQSEVDAIAQERGRQLSAYLDMGLIVSNGDGTFKPADSAA